MIPPWVDAESTIKLEDNWYCSLNEHDPKHSYCSAPERDKVWYNKHFQQMQKMRENGSTLCQEEDLDCNEMKVADKSEEEEKKYILEAKLLLRDSLLCDMNENGTAGKKWFARINVNSDNLDGITDINEVYSTSNNSAMSAVNSDSTNKIESQFVSPKKVLATQDFFVKAQGLAKKLEGPVCKKKENKLPKDLIHRDMLLDQSKTTSIIQKNKVHESGTETTCDSKSKISTSVSTNHQKMKTPSSGSSKMEKTQKNNASLSTICKMIYKKGGNCYQSLSQDDVVNLLSSEDESVTESDNSKDSSPKPNEAKNFQVKPFCGNTEKVINKSEISSDKYVISRESPEKKNRKSQIEENMNLEQPLREGFGTSLKKSDLARKVLKKRKKSRQEEDPRLTDPSKISDKLENHVISFSNKQEEDLRLKNPLKISKTKNNHMSSSSESKDIFVPEESQMSRRKQNITMDTSQQPKTPKKPEVSKESQMSRRKQNIAMETSQPPKTPTKPEVEELVTLVRSSGRKIKMSSKFTSSNITLSQSSKRTRGHSVPKSSPKSKEKRSKKDCAGFRSIQLLSSLSSGSDDDSEMKCPVSKSKRKFSKKSSQTSAGSDNDSLGMSSSILREKKMSKHFLSDRSPKKKASQLTNESNSQKSDVEHVSKFPKRAKKFSKTLSETSLESENNHELKNSLKDREKFLVKTIITEKSIKQRLSQSPKANETDFSKSDDSFSKSRSAKRIRQLSKRSSKTSLRSGNDSLVKNSLRHKETVSMKKISSEKCMRQRSSQSSKSCETDSLGVNSLSGKRKLPWDTRSSERFQISPKHKKKNRFHFETNFVKE
uniref:CW-type domain-containing protein n=1 Tax=Corethron hystrix TaxID=216773 RepID=A0A7S1FVL9_9STRA|mmetsp:Transcript_35529/g.82474  ORF Transcript_35529/g.82474 Transcript_35529/m.82474 type:complete len:829 (+) Transcript_35529:2706-5192(+)